MKLNIHVLGKIRNEADTSAFVIFAECNGCRAITRIQIDKAQMENIRNMIKGARAFIEAGFPPFDYEKLKSLGQVLFELIFKDNVRSLLFESIGAANGALSVELFIEDFEMAGWPWEYTYDISNDRFICQGNNQISRVVLTLNVRKPATPLGKKIKILIAVGILPQNNTASPQSAIKWITGIFRNSIANDSTEIDVIQVQDLQRLDRVLLSGNYDIFHYHGHASYDESKGIGFLKFEHSKGSYLDYPATTISNVLSVSAPNVRLVFLSACESARGAINANPARSSIAAAIMEKGIPAVIGTQFSIPEISAHYLSSMIYDALVAGNTLSKAIQIGRNAMSYAEQSKFFDWGIPVLYTEDPDLVLFPRKKGKKQPTWVNGFMNAISSNDFVPGLAIPESEGAPTLTVPETIIPENKAAAKVKVALVDFDAMAGFLPELIEKANSIQSYFNFQVSYIPAPMGITRTDLNSEYQQPQMFIPALESYMKTKPEELKVDKILCLTQNLIAGIEEDGTYWKNYFTGSLDSNENVSFISTFELNKFSQEAGTSLEKAILFLCLAQLLVTDNNTDLEFHDNTECCLFDMCDKRSDIVCGLRKMKLDHAECRAAIKEPELLDAVDKLLALQLDHKENPIQPQSEKIDKPIPA